MTAPTLTITVPLEGPPTLQLTAVSEEDERAMFRWLITHPDLEQLVLDAYRIAERMAA